VNSTYLEPRFLEPVQSLKDMGLRFNPEFNRYQTGFNKLLSFYFFNIEIQYTK